MKYGKRLALAVLVSVVPGVLYSTVTAAQGCGFRWRWASPAPTGFKLHDLTWNGTRLVAVGDSGAIVSSSDGVSWTQENSGAFEEIDGVAWGNGIFVACGRMAGIWTSGDGENWIMKRAWGLERVSFQGDYFFGNGSGGDLLRSRDGIGWDPVNATGGWWSRGPLRVVYGNEIYVGFGQAGSAFTSPDGMSWREHYTPMTSVYDLAYGNGVFVAAGLLPGGGPLTVLTSADGITWRISPTAPSGHYSNLVYGNGQFLVLGNQAAYRSANGITWETLPINVTPQSAWAIVWADQQYVALGTEPDFRRGFYTSSDGATWQVTPIEGLGCHVNRIRAVGSPPLFVAVSRWDPSCGPMVSSDGRSWTRCTWSGEKSLSGVAFGGGKFVAVGSRGTVATSADARNWATHSSGVSEDLFDVAYGKGLFIAVGQSGILLTSPDGGTWTRGSSYVTKNLNAVMFASGLFAAVGEDGTVITSADGLAWVSRLSEPGHDFGDIAFGSAGFAAMGDECAATSADGVTWEFKWSLPGDAPVIAWHGEYISANHGYGITTSPNGLDWTELKTGDSGVEGLAANDELVVASFWEGLGWSDCVPLALRAEVTYGPSDGGTSVPIIGRRLSEAAQVLFGETLATRWNVDNDQQITATSPPHYAEEVPITVLASDGPTTLGQYSYFRFSGGPPIILGLINTRVATTGGTSVTCWGHGFNYLSDVSVSGAGSVLSFQAYGGSLVFQAPARAAGAADVTVTNEDGLSFTASGALLYMAPPAVTQVNAGGKPFRLKIKGSNFNGILTVRVNGKAAPSVQVKKSTLAVAKGGDALKALMVSGQNILAVLNDIDGVPSGDFVFDYVP